MLLLTIPGIGWLTGGFLVVTTLNFTLCETAEAAVHFIDLAPMVRLSVTSIHGRGKISRGGHRPVRSQLYLATLTAACFNPIIKPYYDRLRAAGKPSDPSLAVRVLSLALAHRLCRGHP